MKNTLLFIIPFITVLTAAPSGTSPTRQQGPVPVQILSLNMADRCLAISPDMFQSLEFFSQYAGAAYCDNNNGGPNIKIVCPAGNCKLVESADTVTLTDFQQ